MTKSTSLTRAGAALVTTGLLIGMLSACAPTSEPTSTPKASVADDGAPFDSDEEAFAAAEKTYRAYNDADNEMRRGNDSADPLDFLTADARTQILESRQKLVDLGYRLEGDVPITNVLPDFESINTDRTELRLTVCFDLTTSRVILENGEEADLPDRPGMIAQHTQLTWVEDTFLVSEEAEGDVSLCSVS